VEKSKVFLENSIDEESPKNLPEEQSTRTRFRYALPSPVEEIDEPVTAVVEFDDPFVRYAAAPEYYSESGNRLSSSQN